MEGQAGGAEVERLEAFVGTWSIAADFPGVPPSDLRGRMSFEWLAGGRFLIQRWEVPLPEAPDGIAVIGFDAIRETLLQHYFDSRGVARLYEMRFDGREWELSRTAADFSPLSFSQRFSGTFSADGTTISGRWETSPDGTTWEHDFDLTYTRSQ